MNVAKLTNLQLEQLKLFAHNLQENQLLQIKALLADYFAQNLMSEMNELWDTNEWTNETMQQWANEHQRTPYKL
jgi:cytochrome b subunit of formate dehydrogenase